jgi:hypothetical protein
MGPDYSIELWPGPHLVLSYANLPDQPTIVILTPAFIL